MARFYSASAAALLSLAVLLLPGCSETRYHLIYGPSTFELSPTPWGSPGLSIEIDEGGVIWLGPSEPDAAQLGYISDNGTEPEPEPDAPD